MPYLLNNRSKWVRQHVYTLGLFSQSYLVTDFKILLKYEPEGFDLGKITKSRTIGTITNYSTNGDLQILERVPFLTSRTFIYYLPYEDIYDTFNAYA